MQSVSVEFQRGTTPVSAYYDLALSILEGDATSLLALVGKLPDEAKKTELRAHHERRIRDAAEAAAAEETAARTAEADAMAHRLDRVASLRPLAPIHRVESNSSFASSDTKGSIEGEEDSEANDVMRELFTLEDDDDEDCCPVCLDAKVSVSCVPCGHSLCAGCLELWRQTNASFYAVAKNGADAVATTCPMCRAHITGFTEYVHTVPKHGAHKRRETTPNPNDGGIERRIDGDGGQESMEESNGRRKESRGARARRKKREVENAGDVDGGFGPADYRAYGDSRCGDASSTADDDDGDAPIVVWFRQDLRVRDNPALHAAARTGRPVVPCFVWCPSEDGAWPMGGASRYWAHHALQSLNAAINSRYGGGMCVRDARHARGSSFDELAAVARECGAKDVYCNRVYEPWKLARDETCEAKLNAIGIGYRSFNAGTLYEPWDAAPDRTDEACWNSGYGSVRFFLRGKFILMLVWAIRLTSCFVHRVRSTGRAAAAVAAAAHDASTASGGVSAAVRRYRCPGFGAHAGGSPRGQSHRLVRGDSRRVVSFFFILVCAIGLTACFVSC